ncbi:MAG: hypothetical protein K5629_03400 [Eubacteriales bacterium]|nr:hypothetical protein [Eubacteriales bacterium]MCR4722803.1 hypothetical protein [Eubacteriales bacterium]
MQTLVTKNISVGQLAAVDDRLLEVLQKKLDVCFQCSGSMIQSLEFCCESYGVDTDEIVSYLNDYLAANPRQ